MTGALILTAIIVVVIYFYMRRHAKRNRAEDIDSVRQFHDNYLHRQSGRKNPRITSDAYRTYVTKYNSTEDYRERRGQ